MEQERDEPIHVLVVAANQELVGGLLLRLDTLGVEVSVCAGMEEALTRCRDRAYPLILVDHQPDGNAATDFCARLRALPAGGDGVLVALTEPGASWSVRQLLDSGCDDVLTKGEAPELFRARLENLVRRARGRVLKLAVGDALRESEARVRAVVDTVMDGIVTINERGEIISFNQAAEKTFGYAAEEVMGKNVKLLMPEPYHGAHDGYIRNYLKSGQRKVIGMGREVTALRKDGTAFPIDLAVGESLAGTGRTFTGVVRDITERKRMEEALREREAGLKQAQAIAHIGHWEWNVETGTLLWSDEIYRIFGLDPERSEVTYEGFLNSVHPDDRALVQDEVNAALAKKRPYSIDHRIVRPSGEERVVHEEAEITYHPDTGRPLRMVGTVHDITERKRAEEILARSHEDLLSILNGLRIGAAITDEQGRVSFLSGSAQRICGRRLEDAIGRPWTECLPLTDAEVLAVREMTALSPERREKVPVRVIRPGEREYRLELDILDDPRDGRRKIFLIYDVTEVYDLRRQLDHRNTFHDMVGKSPAMRQVFQQIQDVAGGDWTVLIEGQTGTGKELVSRAIHAASRRRDRPFIAVNAAGLTDSVLASQLFGHKRGSFTGAVEDHKGYFEAADGGTLFLDEIGDIPLGVQTSLLRVLQEREITRLGESTPRKVDVRILAATNGDLTAEVEAGRFRADLLYRIRVARIFLPPLKARREDIPLLVGATLSRLHATAGKEVESVSTDAMRRLTEYPWPGNVRELVNAIEFAVIRARGRVIELADLPPEVAGVRGHIAVPAGMDNTPFPLSKEDERSRILDALVRAGGNRVLAARLLSISRATLYRKMSALEIPTHK